MAQVPNVPLPSVSPSSQPITTQQITPPAGAFGANVLGAAAEEGSKTAGDIATELQQHATTFQAINNKVAADAATTQLIAGASDLHTKFAEAVKNDPDAPSKLPQLYSDVEDLRTSLSANLSPAAQIEYDSASRRYVAQVQAQAVTAALAGRTNGTNNVQKALVGQAAALYAQDPTNPDNDANLHAVVGQSAAVLGNVNNWGTQPDGSNPQAEMYMKATLGAAYTDAINNAASAGDINTAQAIAKAHAGDMTADQLMKVNRSLKIGEQSALVDGIRLAAQTGQPFVLPSTLSTAVTNNPTNLKPPPSGAWPGQTGVTPSGFATFGTRQDGENAAVQNLQAYGTKHGIDTLAEIAARWAPATDHNNPVAYAASLGRTLGIDPNAHIDMTNVPLLHQIVQAQIPLETGNSPVTGQKIAVPDLRVPSTPTLPDVFEAQKMAEIDKFVTTQFASNPEQAPKVQAGLESALRLNTSQMRATLNATYQTFGQVVANNNIQDVPSMLSQVPGGAAAFAQLPGQYQQALTNATNRNANEKTPDRLNNMQMLDGLKALAPADFMNQNLTTLDLPANERLTYMKAQDQLRANTQKQIASDGPVNHILASPEAAAALGPKGINLTPNTPKYYQFVGALQAQVSQWEAANPDKPNIPAPEQARIISAVTAAQGKNWQGQPSGPYAYEVPTAARAQVIAALAQRGITNPTEIDIARQYRLGPGR